MAFKAQPAILTCGSDELLRQSKPQKIATIRRDGQSLWPENLRIPDEWFVADYFENRLRSNWERGYSRSAFKGTLENAAAYLGCGKGFLVKAYLPKREGFNIRDWNAL
jgi:hypothetical protein